MHPSRKQRAKATKQGVALVVVLALITIMGILIVAILATSSSELKSARIYSDGIEVRQMNETAVNLAVGQLRLGTRQLSDLPGKEVWASQPGAIRVYAESGTFERGVKLYSDSVMTTISEPALSEDIPPTDWNSDDNQIRYTDLNEPVIRKDDIFFPIVNPAAFEAGVNGFDFEESAVAGANKNGSLLEKRLPMPVEWLYVLRRGEMGTLDNNGKFSGSVEASSENPIVGRVAFWTDDESSKINVNTASEPTFWDTPRAINKKDMDYGKFQPGRNEYQRYPGHPATTALSPVLFPNATDELSSAKKEEIYELIPRVGGGGTTGGTMRQLPGEPIVTDRDRLFASIDEFIFQPDREQIELINPESLRMASFFLTANSRSPELNPLGKPKIAMWPLGANTYPRTAFDHLIAFCSTTGDHLYAFQRERATSPVSDWDNISRNQELFSWLVRDLNENVPGTGAAFSGKFGPDLEQITTEIFDYIRTTNLNDLAPIQNRNGTTSKPRNFAGNGQVAPIRTSDEHMGFGRFFTISEFGLHFICNGHGGQGLQPPGGPKKKLKPNERLVEAGFLMEPFSPSIGWPRLHNNFTVIVTGLDSLKTRQVVGTEDKQEEKSMEFPAPQRYRPRRLDASWHGRAWGGSSGIRTFVARNNYPLVSMRMRIKGDSISFSGGKVKVEIYDGDFSGTKKLDPKRKIQTIELLFPPADFPVPELVRKGTTKFRGTVATSQNFWWTLGTRYGNAHRTPHAPGIEYAEKNRRWPPDRGGQKPGFKTGGVFRSEDVVRTLVPAHGDHRLFAAVEEVADTVFVPNHNYHDKTVQLDHTFADTQGTHLLYGFSNEPGLTSKKNADAQLTPADYHYSRLPDVPYGAGAFNLYGDFDNGVAQIGDGAFINRPDEGNAASKGQYSYFAWNYSKPRLVNFSPNRMIPSPGVLGSLPVGIKRNRPWETLLFRPQPGHPGSNSPSDHLLMEYFWMPVVEPFAISEPFSTAGKINMNYRMVPFSYIKRSTGLHGVLKSEEPLAIPNDMSKVYKLWDHETSDHPWLPSQGRGNLDPQTREDWKAAAEGKVPMRKRINIDETLKQFEEKFDSNALFTYPSEICDIHLVRENETLNEYKDQTFWAGHVVTGDNVRERPYANIYPRLTTRSNIYRIHTRVEMIRKSRESPPDQFSKELDSVVGRYRGSTLVERYIDPTKANQPDYAAPGESNEDLFDSYHFRILESKRFSP